jgi:hypothetical protein
MQKTISLTACVLLTGAAHAADLNVAIEVPRLSVAEYHRPYVAVWIEGPDRTAMHLDVWYDVKLKDHEGAKWLKDLRAWWRRIGRDLTLPADGVSGATRAPGAYELAFPASHPAIANLAPGEYRLMVEAAREVGGRELIEIPFRWPATEIQRYQAQGQHELGAVAVTVKP